MVEVEQRSLGALEEDEAALAQRAVDEQRRVGDVRTEPLRVALVARRDVLEVDRLRTVDLLEPVILLRERDLDLLAQDLRVEQVLDADPEPRRLVAVRRADPAPRRADLEPAEPTLARPVERDVPGHDQLGVPGQVHLLGREPARLQLVQLLDEHRRIDDAAGTEHALLAPEDPRGHVPELVRLPVGDDGVAGVRTALVAADEIRVLGQQVDDLALALVAPLRPDDDGRWHGLSCCARHAAARSANFAYRLRNATFSVPVGPFRCFARWISAIPCWSVSSL